MVICKRPCRIYDVDAVGFLTVLLIGATGYQTGFVSLQDQNRTLVERRQELAAVRAAAKDVHERRVRVGENLKRFRAQLAGVSAQVPTVNSLTQFLSELATLARRSDLEVLQIVPGRTETQHGHAMSDISVTARGRSIDFIRFLGRLERASPHQSLQRLSIARRAQSQHKQCELAWTIRLHMLPAEVAVQLREES